MPSRDEEYSGEASPSSSALTGTMDKGVCTTFSVLEVRESLDHVDPGHRHGVARP